MDSEKDQKVKRIARFLELGGTMLAEHCKVCGAPKFRYQGQVICPLCDVREEGEEETEASIEAVPEAPVERPAPETGTLPEKSRPWYDTNKEVQESRQNSWFEPRRAEAAVEVEERVPQFRAEVQSPVPESKELPRQKAAVQNAGPADVLELQGDRAELEALLLRKLISIATFLQAEKDPRRVIEEFELIEKGLSLIESLRKY
ncbi:hypothetical protein MSMTP_3170 [Methanosarcina sp. MTP4]|uniref:Sjogren's syndrome/scleroderma autoantigen 1 family protein n=1 Tax=Methanosarcina sp. MTP4 TaxID=1434100 RepID=UPI000615A43C|nr:Sjogren's syndrome/scleroderma autoantigen 1 family protein [Methanosarcina sp. MTP4]AKB26639.1 hypothetical protein MSMTP_3170 [Methanosarcina sp. MTP4]